MNSPPIADNYLTTMRHGTDKLFAHGLLRCHVGWRRAHPLDPDSSLIFHAIIWHLDLYGNHRVRDIINNPSEGEARIEVEARFPGMIYEQWDWGFATGIEPKGETEGDD